MEFAHEAFDKLCEKYPVIFQDSKYSPMQSCMGRGQEFPDAWYDLIDSLCDSLQWDTDKNGYPQVVFEQIKEKFGRLTIYYRTEDTEKYKEKSEKQQWRSEGVIEGMIDAYAIMSTKICDTCGTNQNIIQKKGWIRYVCKSCDKRQERQKKISHIKWTIKYKFRKAKGKLMKVIWPY